MLKKNLFGRVLMSCILAFGICFAAMLAMPGRADAAYEAYVATQSKTLYLRQSPGGRIITSMPKGARITVISENGDWDYVEYNGRRGYCSAQYVRAVENNNNGSGITGDVNGDGRRTKDDAQMMIDYIADGRASELQNADLNGDGKINIHDVTKLVQMIKDDNNNSGGSLDDLKRQWTGRRWDDRESGSIGSQCFGFANYIFVTTQHPC